MLRLEKSKAFRKLLLSVFNRIAENSKLSDEDCLRLGRAVNDDLARRYGIKKFTTSELIPFLSQT